MGPHGGRRRAPGRGGEAQARATRLTELRRRARTMRAAHAAPVDGARAVHALRQRPR
jgi:hypothetical protein